MPAWFPGAGFIKVCQTYKRRAEAFSDVPFKFVKRHMDTGTCAPSFLSNLLQKCDVRPGSEEERIIKWSAGSLYAGGADTVREKSTPSRNGDTKTYRSVDCLCNRQFFSRYGILP